MKTYVTYGAYRKHASRHHAEVFENANSLGDTECDILQQNMVFSDDVPLDNADMPTVTDVAATPSASTTECEQRGVAGSSCDK